MHGVLKFWSIWDIAAGAVEAKLLKQSCSHVAPVVQPHLGCEVAGLSNSRGWGTVPWDVWWLVFKLSRPCKLVLVDAGLET